MDFEDICRLCLQSSMDMHSIFIIQPEMQLSIVEILESFTNLHIESGDELPQKICNNCKDFINNIYYFKNQAEQNEEYLLKVIKYGKDLQCDDDSTIISKKIGPNGEFFIIKEISDISQTELIVNEIEDSNNHYEIREYSEKNEIKVEKKFLPNSQTTCKFCFSKFENELLLEKHMKIHVQKKYACTVCKEEFPQEFNRREHMINVHNLQYKAINKKSKLCKYCNERSTQISVHIRLKHPDVTPYTCNFCNRSFKRPYELRYHIAVHQSSNPYQCGECNSTFPTKFDMDNHKEKAHAKSTHKCNLCEKRFKKKAKLRSHMNTTHFNIKPHKCPYCEHGFQSTTDLKYHIRTHTGERPFECGECGKTFTKRSVLRTHCIRNKHPIEKMIEKPSQ